MFTLPRKLLKSFNAANKQRRLFNFHAMSDSISLPPQHPGNERRKRDFQGGRGSKRQRIQKEKPVKEGSSEEVLLADVRALFAAQNITDNPPPEGENGSSDFIEASRELPTPFTEVDVKVLEISSTGDGLAQSSGSDQVYVVPFTAPGDVVRIKVIKHFAKERYSLADFVRVIEPSALRDDSRIRCKYFSKCSGCQFQMLDYATQLKHKKTIVEKAYKNFSQLPLHLVPTIEDTMGSPLQYGYRTKLTPHFDGPPGYRSRTNKKAGTRKTFEEVPEIGFMQKGQRKTLDIEDCPIGTDAVRMGMKSERRRVAAELAKYQRGATILLRESTKRIPRIEGQNEPEEPSGTIVTSTNSYTDFKTCITDNNATSTEYVDSFTFTNPAGAFFQNNNSILPSFTQYIRERILPPAADEAADIPKIKYLIDAYSGSGLFTITLASLFTSSTGIDISSASIDFARKNAELNSIPSSRASFMAADAPELFKSVTYPANETVVVIDPPRKGCDESFLSQLLKFAPRRVAYVSCNVHTQARDVGVLVKGKDGVAYKIESLKGFDFFPQTGHVEGVAVLSRVDQVAQQSLDT
ncbi:MAG: tRNA(m5U54)methyltransferase [Claussenomyces sp. TS43310]|nr:MAG: tRNA(m5U54)methyltransferase [Claussenomyces sp. TS43310]